MKRDIELMREILFAVEAEFDPLEIDDSKNDAIKYHIALLIEAGLVKGVTNSSVSTITNIPDLAIARDLTWSGHEFLDSIRQEEVWNTLKKEFKESSFETLKSVGKQLAESFAKNKLEALLKNGSGSSSGP